MAAVNRPNHFWHNTLPANIRNEFFMKLNVTELRDGITSLHGIHVLSLQWIHILTLPFNAMFSPDKLKVIKEKEQSKNCVLLLFSLY